MSRVNARLTSRITLLADLFSIITAYYLSAFVRGGILVSGLFNGHYGNALILLVLSHITISSVNGNNRNIFKRGYFEELQCILKDQSKLGLILLGYMFGMKLAGEYSRVFFTVFFILNTLLSYVLRSYMKVILLLVYKKSSSSSKVMLITVSKDANRIVQSIRQEYEWKIYVTSIAIYDDNRVGRKIDGIPVIAHKENILEQARLNVVDEVFIHLPGNQEIELESLILELEKMGITVHMYLDIFHNMNLKNKTIEEFAGHQVITFATTLFDDKHIVVKRLVDILGGLVGSILCVIIIIFLAPAILIESPGPIFFSQTRVGKNGRKFKIYKFRSMYRDAEQRKKDLLERNEMQGLMFKIADDPRITKVGKFIRKTSLDEFPQFFNVVKGDMSLVGTRPPTEDEFLLYEGRHKRRLMLKPGITGLWQVSGRSNIENFEDVVKLDLQYIDHWSLKMDIKLLFKTVGVVVLRRGSK